MRPRKERVALRGAAGFAASVTGMNRIITLVLMAAAFGNVARGQIANPPPVPEWILAVGAATNQPVFFRKAFVAPAGLLKAILLGACDGTMSVQLNGETIGEISGRDRARGLDLTKRVRPGTNVLVLQARPTNGVATVSALLELNGDLARQQWIDSDATWLAAASADGDFLPVRSLGRVDAQPDANPFDARKAFDAYNSWKLALNANTATPADSLTLPPGFKAELLRSALPEEGSWIALAFDPQGRLTIAREKRGLLRMTLGSNAVAKIEVINDTLLECRGLLYAYDALYVNANNSKAFVRLRDTKRDGQFDEVKELLRTEGGVGHGRNHVVLGPDGMIYLVHGNDVVAPPNPAPSSPHRRFRNDRLIPCPWDDHLFDSGVTLPAGHILRTDRDGTKFELVAGGFRNPLDVAFNEDGEMFTFDADMEWDVGLPWYRPNRVNHVVSGGEYGWRRGTAKWPDYFPDVVPSTLDIGLASPTAVEFGYASKFAERYKKALYLCDWSYGRILAVHFQPRDASYYARSESFISGRPLNVTDLTFGPDGAMYFVTGGRGTQSGLYRVFSTNTASGPVLPDWPFSNSIARREKRAPETRALRHKLEALQSETSPGQSASIIDTVWPHLGAEDRAVRYAARIALEHQNPQLWQQRALKERSIAVRLMALLALARVGTPETPAAVLQRLNADAPERWGESDQLLALRIYALALANPGGSDASAIAASLAKLEPLYPAGDHWANHLLCELLVHLKSPSVIRKTLDLLAKAESSEDLVQYLFYLRYVREGWTPEQRLEWFRAWSRAEKLQGGRYYGETLQEMKKEMFDTLPPAERAIVTTMLASHRPAAVPVPARPFVREWKLDDLLPALEQAGRGRSFASGKAAAQAAQCGGCHRIGGEFTTSVIGPDLTAVASRFGRRDILDAILSPSKVIDEKYRLTSFLLKDGSKVTGSVEREDAQKVFLRTDPLADEPHALSKANLVRREWSAVSPMPEGLLNTLTRDEILDLLAFLEAGGAAGHPAFKR